MLRRLKIAIFNFLFMKHAYLIPILFKKIVSTVMGEYDRIYRRDAENAEDNAIWREKTLSDTFEGV